MGVDVSTAPPDGEAPEARRPRPTSGRTLVLVGTLLAVAVMLALPLRSWLGQRSELAELESLTTAAQQRVADLERQKVLWQDPVYVAAQARLRLNMVRPAEMGLIVLDPDLKPDVAQPGAAAPQTWYGRLWESAVNPARGVSAETAEDDRP